MSFAGNTRPPPNSPRPTFQFSFFSQRPPPTPLLVLFLQPTVRFLPRTLGTQRRSLREGAVSCSLLSTAVPGFSPSAQQQSLPSAPRLLVCMFVTMLIASSHHNILFWFLKINFFRYNLQTRKHPFQLCRLMSFEKCVNKRRRPEVRCFQQLNRPPHGPAWSPPLVPPCETAGLMSIIMGQL